MLSSIHIARCASSLREAMLPEGSMCQKLRRQLGCCAAVLRAHCSPVNTSNMSPWAQDGARVSLLLKCVQCPFNLERFGRCGTCAAITTTCLEDAHF